MFFSVNICRAVIGTNSSAMVCLGRVHDWEEFTAVGPHPEFHNSCSRRVLCLGTVFDWEEFAAVGPHPEFLNSRGRKVVCLVTSSNEPAGIK